MRALLYKDCYMIYKYNRFFLITMLLFVIIAGMNEANMFFSIYPTIVLAGLSLSSLAYDERSGWLQYADALPYGRKKIVASKFLLAVLSCLTAMVLMTISIVGFGWARGAFDPMQLVSILVIMLAAGTVYVSIMLPVSFWFGTEKGRMVYILFTVLFCCGAYSIPWPFATQKLDLWFWLGLLAVAMVIIWSVSYLISVQLYQRRKLV